MGIGEPLDNFDEVMKFLENITSPEGVNIGMRNISLSTCGLVPKIDQLAEKKLQLTLSVSLHAPNNEIRSGMMPVNDAIRGSADAGRAPLSGHHRPPREL